MKNVLGGIVILTLLSAPAIVAGEQQLNVKPPPTDISAFKSALKVLSPNGGETWCKGGFGRVTWSETSIMKPLKVWIKISGQEGIFSIGYNIPPGTKSADYTIPANLGYEGQIFKVVVATMDGKVVDESDGCFTIRKPFIETQMNGTEEQQYTGPCPVTLHFSAKIHVEMPCQVKYKFWYEDGSESQVFSTLVQSTRDVPFSRTINGTLQGHVCVRIVSPSQVVGAGAAYFNVHCSEAVK
ncbi:MAG TPA: hypothetical protein PKK12_04160 [Candidatus Aminicenantes bacterium]|nr:hypothetical protein [Candidatus Aminicenantes bacterium]